MIQKITDAGLTPPTKIEDIPLFLKNLEVRQEGIKSGNCTLKNFLKSLFVWKKVLTFASAFENEGIKEFFERFT